MVALVEGKGRGPDNIMNRSMSLVRSPRESPAAAGGGGCGWLRSVRLRRWLGLLVRVGPGCRGTGTFGPVREVVVVPSSSLVASLWEIQTLVHRNSLLF